MNEHLKRVHQVLSLIQFQPIDGARARRFGSKNDGGYILIDDLDESDFLISMGIANDVNFESDLSRIISGCHLYDDSIEKLPRCVENGIFFKERIGGYGNTSITDAMYKVDSKHDLLLKIDIEGSEWEALHSLESDQLEKFRQIVIEYHWLERILIDNDYFRIISVLEKLNQSHFVLNSHPNNNGDVYCIENVLLPSVIEVTYLRKKDYKLKNTTVDFSEFINLLNSPCNPDYPEVHLYGRNNPNKVNLFTKSVGVYSRSTFDALARERDALARERDALARERDALVTSRIWRAFGPYRLLRRSMASIINR